MSLLQQGHARIRGLASSTFFVLLIVGLLVGCGSGGGGVGTSPSSPPTTVTQTIGSVGGTVSLPDGTVVAFAGGVLSDGTQVKVTSAPSDSASIPSGTQALSRTVSVEIPVGMVSAVLGDSQTITMEIPPTTPTSSALARLIFPNEAMAQATTISDLYRTIKATAQIGSEVVTYYAPDLASAALKLTGKALVKAKLDDLVKKLSGRSVPPGTELILKLLFVVYNVQQCFLDSMRTYELRDNGSFSDPTYELLDNGSFSDSIRRDVTRTPLILIHGWQEISSSSCRNPYQTTWSDPQKKRFVELFLNDPDLVSKFQVFSVHYNSMNSIISTTGPELAGLLNRSFGSSPVVVLAYSMGGLVARTAVAPPPNVNPANIALLITLATPHHGSPLASREAFDILRNPVFQILELALSIAAGNPSNLLIARPGAGLKDANHDGFDGLQFYDLSEPPQLGNPNLVALQASESQRSAHSKYVAFAGQVQEPTVGAILRNMGYENDVIIPVASAQFDGVTIKQRALFSGLSHSSILEMGVNQGVAGKDVWAAVRTALIDFTPPPSPPPPSQGTWSATKGTLTTARTYHTATRLSNGKVLVSGGRPVPFSPNSNPRASAELYDQTIGIWITTDPMNTARSGHSATLLSNGKVLVAGGSGTSGDLALAELYDPATGRWSFTDPMITARSNHAATLLASGKVLVAGGQGGALAELYDPATGTWTATGSLRTARSLHTATLLPNGKILVAGGCPANSGCSSHVLQAELYDPATGIWSFTGLMVTGRDVHTATLLSNGKVLVTGGYGDTAQLASAELYDPATGEWTSTRSMSTARVVHAAVLLPNGKVLVAGRYDVATAELYDPTTGTWTSTGSMTTVRHHIQHVAVLLGTGQVLVVGGTDSSGGNALASAELYQP
jgi:hypothetical protein